MNGSSHAFSRPRRTHGIAICRDFAPVHHEPRRNLSARSIGRLANPKPPSLRDRRARSKTPRDRVKNIRHPVVTPGEPTHLPEGRSTDPSAVSRVAFASRAWCRRPAARTAPRSTSSGEGVRGCTAPRHTGPGPARFSAPLRAPRRSAPPAGWDSSRRRRRAACSIRGDRQMPAPTGASRRVAPPVIWQARPQSRRRRASAATTSGIPRRSRPGANAPLCRGDPAVPAKRGPARREARLRARRQIDARSRRVD
jgi:hypothetical protein